ncbi:MAG: glycosyltransferase family 4 protein [Dysgonamonadaceae bacterium]|nr:glycosyltransferase family 4 protein [Dysgonamonadaceae bacterium]
MENRKKFFIITTIPVSFIFFRGQITFLKNVFDIHLVSSSGSQLDEICEKESVKGFEIDMARDIDLLKDLKSLFKLIKLFNREKPHVIHCNTPKGSLLSLVAGFITRVPHRIYYVHGLRYEGDKGAKRKILMLMEKVSSLFSTHIIAVSNGVKATMEQEITKKHIDVIGYGSVNGLDVDLFNRNDYDVKRIKEGLQINEADFVYGFVGRLVGDKGINELIEAFKAISSKYNNAKLVLVGYYEDKLDPLKESTLDEIKRNTNIINLGFQKDVKPYLAILDIFVFPSYREGFGISLMEANAMGVPAISSDITGCNEIIEEGMNGFLIEPHDEKSLYDKMEYAYLNKDVIEEMSVKSREIIKKKFSQQFVWENSLEKYKKIVRV